MNKEQNSNEPQSQQLNIAGVSKRYFKGGLIDMNTGKQIENGHIVAVRYVWNSYVGEVCFLRGLCATGAKRHAFFSPHSLKDTTTYQIIGHINKEHSDYNEEVLNWYKSETGDCPIKITIYDNCESVG
jgi:hypothetical protein